jgi:hypothetical protein
MLAPCEPILGSCWAYVGPILTHFWPILAQIKNFDPFENMQKHRILEQKCPPKLKLISYNAIANGSRRHTKNASAPSVRADFGEFLMILEGFWGRLLMIFDDALNEHFGNF